MASTYSSVLRLELMADGDQQGTWGQTTNRNLQSVVEAAIAGYSTVSVTSANQALTANNGITDQARSASLKFTTTTTADFSVYVPPASKQYSVYNASAYTLTIYNSTALGNTTAAGVGTAIPAGKIMNVVSDGTNVSGDCNYIPALTLGTPLAKAYGGTGGTGGGIPTGAMIDYGGTTAPAGTDFLLCDGASYTTAAQPTLFAVIGYTYGGSGSNFNVPDTRRRTTIGSGGTAVSGPANTIGSTGGAETHTLTTAQLAAHNHVINISDPTHSHGVSDPTHVHGGSYNGFDTRQGGAGGAPNLRNDGATVNTAAASTGISISGNATGITATSNNNGSGAAHNIMQPSLVVMKLIKT